MGYRRVAVRCTRSSCTGCPRGDGVRFAAGLLSGTGVAVILNCEPQSHVALPS
ncbi:hypothetical protein ACFQJ5_10145 [Halomicroarcula sp. GCM10025324]|uniref:hypothetical protein n=1 Tax=Halomicroarcula sp. GCM10025324 TaxID=3252667 RepID=UPI0036200304